MGYKPKGPRTLTVVSILVCPRTHNYMLSARGLDRQWHNNPHTTFDSAVSEAITFLTTQAYARRTNPKKD